MKLRKHISKLLALGLLTNNIYFNSSANTEIPNRYQTLEGEHITIDDSTEGELVEIEVFGNTVQDENNLEDIQSVGDLYVDEKGDPILDSQGRKQYKIDIKSWDGLNYFDLNNINYGRLIHSTGEVDISQTNCAYTDYIKVVSVEDNNYLKFKCFDEVSYLVDRVILYDENKNHVLSIPQVSLQGNVHHLNEGMYMRIGLLGIENYTLDEIRTHKWMMSYDISEYKEVKSNTMSLMLPTQLQKVGDITDKLYWDNKKGRYVIEKNIGRFDFNKDMGMTFVLSDDGTLFRSDIEINIPNLEDVLAWKAPNIISNKLTTYSANTLYSFRISEGISAYGSGIPFIVNETSLLSSQNVEGVRKWIDKNKLYIYYAFKTPELINTNITSKLQISTYEGQTHLYAETENGINPTLKVVVDRLPNISKDAVGDAKSDTSIEKLSLARMYVNMLPESLYKDSLQAELNNIFSTDVTFDKKTVSSNVDVYIKSENMLSISLDTNSVTFEGYSGAAPMELKDAVNITINSSLPYDLNAYMPTEISNNDGSSNIAFDIFNIKESTETTYNQFADTTNEVVLKSDCAKGNNKSHKIDLKLDSNNAHKADIYKTVIRFEAVQK